MYSSDGCPGSASRQKSRDLELGFHASLKNTSATEYEGTVRPPVVRCSPVRPCSKPSHKLALLTSMGLGIFTGLRYELGVPVVELRQLQWIRVLQEIRALVDNWACTLYTSEANEKQHGV